MAFLLCFTHLPPLIHREVTEEKLAMFDALRSPFRKQPVPQRAISHNKAASLWVSLWLYYCKEGTEVSYLWGLGQLLSFFYAKSTILFWHLHTCLTYRKKEVVQDLQKFQSHFKERHAAKPNIRSLCRELQPASPQVLDCHMIRRYCFQTP